MFEKQNANSFDLATYSNSSYTCTHVGGEYCGKYRMLTKPAIPLNEKLTENPIPQ
jgi:hypothetical protein